MARSSTCVPCAPSTIRRQARAQVLRFFCAWSGSSKLIPLTNSFGVGRNLLRSLPHGFPVGQLGKLLAVVQEVSQVSIEPRQVAKVHADDPLAGAVLRHALLRETPGRPEHREVMEAVGRSLTDDALVLLG